MSYMSAKSRGIVLTSIIVSFMIGMMSVSISVQQRLMLGVGVLLAFIAVFKIEFGIYILLWFSGIAGLWGFDLPGFPPIYFVEIMIVILLLAFLLFYRKKFVSSSVSKPLILIIIWAAIAVIGSIYVGSVNFEPNCYKEQGKSFVMILLPIGSYFLIANNVSSKKIAEHMIFSIITAGVLLSIYQYYAFFTKGTLRIGYVERVGLFGGNFFGALYMTALLLLMAFLFYYKNRLKKMLCIVLMCFIGFNIITIFARATFIAALIPILLFAFLKKRKLFALLLLCLLIISITYPTFIRPVTEIYSPRITPWVRLPIAYDAIRIIKKNPVFGIGGDRYWNYSTYEAVYCSPINACTSERKKEYLPVCSTHNDYLQMAVNMGIPGLILFLWFLCVIWKETIALYKSTDDEFSKTVSLAFLVTIVGFCIQCFVSESIFGCYGNLGYQGFSARFYFWALLGVVIGVKHVEKEEIALPGGCKN